MDPLVRAAPKVVCVEFKRLKTTNKAFQKGKVVLERRSRAPHKQPCLKKRIGTHEKWP